METKLFKQEHLSEEGVMLYAEAMKIDRVFQLPGSFYKHITACESCRERVTRLYKLVSKLPFAAPAPDSFFGALDIKLQRIKQITRPIKKYERALTMIMRSEEEGAVNIKLASPIDEQLYMYSITFDFDEALAFNTRLAIINEEDETVFGEDLAINIESYTIDKKQLEMLPDGLYYWKLMYDGGLKMGKFYWYKKNNVYPNKSKNVTSIL